MKDKNLPAPDLTLKPDTDTKSGKEIIKDVDMTEKPGYFSEFVLDEDEIKMVEDFAGKIDLHDSDVIVQYGAGAQKKMADFSENALNMVKTKDLGAIGDMLTSVVTELKGFDISEKQTGIMGFFKRGANKLESTKIKYEKAETNINTICSALEQHQIQLLKDIAMLDKMYEINNVYFKELSMYILAGKRKLDIIRNEDLPRLIDKARASGLAEDAQAANDLGGLCDRFEKKIYDLELTRTISLQMGPQIRLVQSNNIVMSEKIQSTLTNTIPLWKSQMVIAIGITHSLEAAKAQQAVSETTNRLLRSNAESLQMATVSTAKEAERGIIDIETLRYTNEKLISTIDEVLRIQDEGREKRRQAELELAKIENELKEKLLSIRK